MGFLGFEPMCEYGMDGVKTMLHYLKKWVNIVLLCLSGTGIAHADTTFVSAGMVEGQWTSLGSPFVIQGDLTVAIGDSLTIGSGVRVYVQGSYGLSISGYLGVDGQLGDSVVFTTDTLLNPAKWRGLSLNNANDSSYIHYAVFENSWSPGPTGPDSLGGAIYVSLGTTVRVTHSTFRNNRSELAGGAVYVTASTILMDSCCFELNYSRAEGGGLFLNNSVNAEVTHSQFYKNYAFGSGGGVYVRGTTPRFVQCVMDSNYARTNGGGIMFKNSFGRLDSSLVNANQARGHGGGIACETSSPLIYDCTIENNSTVDFDGGGVYIWESSPHMLRCRVLNNISADDGGGVHSYRATSNGLFEECEIRGNVAEGEGGGIWVTLDGSPTFNDCLVKQNTAGLYGGAVFLRNNASPSFNNCDFDSNTSLGNGGGLSIRQSQPLLTGCSVRWNSADDEGGGIHLWEAADAVFTECKICNNVSALNGGGISSNQSALSATNCLIADNSTLALGGGLATANSSQVSLLHCTIAGNTNGGIRLESTVADIENSILENPSGSNVYFGASKDSRIAYSLLNGLLSYSGNDVTQGPELLGLLTAVNVNLDSCDTYFNVLDDAGFIDTANGDWNLGVGSPAIGAGNWNSIAGDLLNSPRPLPALTLPDMGAYESPFGEIPSGLFGPLSGTLGPDTVKIVADIVVDSTDNLTIEPGTTMLFCGPSGMNILGTVDALGLFTDSISLTTNTLTNPGGWRGITMSANAGGSVFEFVSITDASAIATKRTQGGALKLDAVSPTFSNCTIARHRAIQGGAIYLEQSSPQFTDCILASSSADSGGVLCVYSGSNPLLDGCVIAGGNALAGGGYLAKGATGQILNCRIEGNSATLTGGGIFLDTSPAVVRNCLMLDNSAFSGGGIWIGSTNMLFEFNTLSENTAVDGAGIYMRFGSSQIKNNIVANNHGDGVFFFVSSTSSVRSNCVALNDSSNFAFFANVPAQGPVGIGALDSLNVNGDACDRYNNIQLDPQWVSGAGHDYYLAHTSTGQLDDSPCINASEIASVAPAGTTRTDYYVDDLAADQGYHGPQLAGPPPPIDDLVIRANADSVWLHWSYEGSGIFSVNTDSTESGSFDSTVAVTADTFVVFPNASPLYPNKGYFRIIVEPAP